VRDAGAEDLPGWRRRLEHPVAAVRERGPARVGDDRTDGNRPRAESLPGEPERLAPRRLEVVPALHVSEFARRGEAVERAAGLDLPQQAGNEVLQRAGVLEAAEGYGVVARVADQLLRDLARLVV